MARGQVVVLPDPEMTLPDERLPTFDTINAVSHRPGFGGDYPSIQALIRARRKVEWKLNAHVTEMQRERLVPGCWAYFELEQDTPEGTERLIVFGEVPSVSALIVSERFQEGDLTHARLLERRVRDAHKRGWLFGKWYSTVAPDGEWGCMHIAELEPMLEESFLAAKARKWKKP